MADIERSQADVVATRLALRDPEALTDKILASVQRGSDDLARIMASADGFRKVRSDRQQGVGCRFAVSPGCMRSCHVNARARTHLGTGMRRAYSEVTRSSSRSW